MAENTERQHSEASPQPTPGPWHIAQADSNLPPYVVSDATGIVVCDLVGPPDRTEANANLIAAAPDLLAAAYRFARVWNDALAGRGPLHFSSDLFDQLGVAISKAEGRQP